jgi:hypothetical protein
MRTSLSRSMRATPLCWKKAGKPLETPPAHKQVYLPYETAPTKSELDRERRRFATCPSALQSGKVLPVADVPENMYTYGKEGMALSISIFKDQTDPVIGPEHTYPGIYENKIACRVSKLEDLFEAERTSSFESPWQEQKLANRVGAAMGSTRARMAVLTQKQHFRFSDDKTASKAPGKKGGTAAPTKGDPDKKK